jgi:hypothetical protein
LIAIRHPQEEVGRIFDVNLTVRTVTVAPHAHMQIHAVRRPTEAPRDMTRSLPNCWLDKSRRLFGICDPFRLFALGYF